MKFSIITPSLNQAKYLNRTLNSVMLQTHSSYEHIVLDPGSKDGSIKIISDYVKNNPNAIFINEPDEGQVDAINKGMALSDGEILTWLNSDDYYLDANVLKNVSDIFSENSSVDIVYGRGEYIDERGKFIKEAHVDSSDHDLKERLSESIGILQPALFYRRRVFESIGGLDAAYNLSLDYEYWIRMAFFGHEFKYVNLKFVAATLHGDSKTIGQRGNQYSEICKLLLSYYGFVKPIWLKRYADFLMNANDGIINVEKTTSPAMFSTKKNLFQKYNATAESLYQALLNLDDEQAQKYLREWLDVNTMKTNKTVLTTSSDKYFDQLLTLIAGLHRTSVDEIDLIVIYDLSLTEEQRQKLFSIQDVIVLPFPLRYKREAWYFKPKSYVYKCAAMANWLTHAVKNDCFIWMDTGIVPLRSINELYSITDEMDAFFINHDDKSETPFPNVNFTHPVSLKKLGANATEALSEHICSCLIGCKVGGSYEKIFVEAFSRSLDRSISDWPKHLDGKEIEKINSKLNGELRQSIVSMSNVELVNISLNDVVDCYPYYGHRQDQSIYSIFAARYSAPILSALKYCCSTDESSVASKKNWETGSNCPNIHKSRIIPEFVKNSLTYHHRGTYSNYDGLLLRKGAVLAAQKNSMKEAKQVANPDEITFKKKNVEILSIIDFTFDRRENAQLDETNLIYHLFQNHFNRVMIDVGGHFGESSYKFAQRDWKIVAFEPDPENRKKFIEKLGHKKNVTLEARAVGETVEQAKVFYASDESTGISGMLKFRDSHKQVATVEVTTIEKVIKEHNIDHIDFLKIDVEGYDFGVLKGVPWDKIKPDVIECEFEDAKTNLLGHTWRDICDYLTGHGYTVYVSEWHPIVRYGIAHDWHTMKKYPCTLADAKAWGNLLAFKDDPGEAAIAEVIKKVTKFRHSEAGTGLKVAQEKTIQAVVKTASNSDTKLSTEKKVTNKMKEKKINLPLQTP
ncbi:FkbM family methyltransferase, partial [bacterium AH-315-J23]|nr:FkbM family methyltransferase [bacterium AH-315-J23]